MYNLAIYIYVQGDLCVFLCYFSIKVLFASQKEFRAFFPILFFEMIQVMFVEFLL